MTLTDLTYLSLSYMNDPVYKETVENSSSYNERLVKERKTRLPFLDAQTGVAQSMKLSSTVICLTDTLTVFFQATATYGRTNWTVCPVIIQHSSIHIQHEGGGRNGDNTY